MKTLYEAANSLEAHMLVDLLKQDGLHAHIQGEHLQGAVGEIPAAGLVRLLIDEQQYDQARRVVIEWEKGQPTPSTATSTANSNAKGLLAYRGLLGFLFGLAFGILTMFALYRTPITNDGIDHNGDGKIDEKWIYTASGRILRSETDRNFDGKIDLIQYFDSQGIIEKAESDDNFDGTFETVTKYKQGSPYVMEVDSNNDGIKDLRYVFAYGVLERMEFLSPYTSKPLRVEYYKLGKLVKAEVDTNKDGTLDTRYFYDTLSQITGSENIQ
jgi:hypothetical protein